MLATSDHGKVLSMKEAFATARTYGRKNCEWLDEPEIEALLRILPSDERDYLAR
jgi:hypothetical protein